MEGATLQGHATTVAASLAESPLFDTKSNRSPGTPGCPLDGPWDLGPEGSMQSHACLMPTHQSQPNPPLEQA